MTLEQQILELEAELSWNDDEDERRQITAELLACLASRIGRRWQAETQEFGSASPL